MNIQTSITWHTDAHVAVDRATVEHRGHTYRLVAYATGSEMFEYILYRDNVRIERDVELTFEEAHDCAEAALTDRLAKETVTQ